MVDAAVSVWVVSFESGSVAPLLTQTSLHGRRGTT
jgi:hypothetical protein